MDLKPLTVFIGPNNSGKSYMSLLVYALSRVGAGSETPGQLRENVDKVPSSRAFCRRSCSTAEPIRTRAPKWHS